MKKLVASLVLGLALFLLTGITLAKETISNNKAWSVAIITKSLFEDSPYMYYLESQLRLIDDSRVFNQFLLLTGLGYQFNSKVALFMGPGWVGTTLPDRVNVQEMRYWQQLHWLMLDKPYLSIISRTRAEESQFSGDSSIFVRLRQRFWARVPIKRWDTYSFSTFNEFFFRVNHPDGASPYTYEQNRFFIGIAKQVTQSIIMDVGYLNQYVFSYANERSNIMFLCFTMNL